MLQPAERYWATRSALLRLLAEVESSGWCRRTVYLTPATAGPGQTTHGHAGLGDSWERRVASVVQQAGVSETGLVVFLGDERAVAVAPPFPIETGTLIDNAGTSSLRRLLTAELLVGVVLLRLGRYAVGVLRGDALVASKTGARYVKGRHRAGGSSQRRFERSRERLVRELFDKTCETVRGVFSPYESGMDHVLMGGERHTLRGFVQRCRYMKGLERITLKRVLQVERPGQKALDRIAPEVWKSEVLTFFTEEKSEG